MVEQRFQSRADIEAHQLGRLKNLVRAIQSSNLFWSPRLSAAGITPELASLDAFRSSLPLLTKGELAADQDATPPYGSNLTYPVARYRRLHQTSSTTGQPLRWLDSDKDWDWLIGGWLTVLDAAEVRAGDRVFVAASFGPFIGFWMAWDAAARLGCLCIPGGGMNTVTRLRAILANDATVLCCTPTYAIRMGETALAHGLNLGSAAVKRLIVAGEPGGSVPAVRERIERLWPTARVFDHHGMTEVGPVTFECPRRPGVLHVNESMYLCELIDPPTGAPLNTRDGAQGELVITTLGRAGSPVLRYRTGDIVACEADSACPCGRHTMRFAGGIIGRADDMVVVRGTNLYPSALDAIIGRFDNIVEYRAEVGQRDGMTELSLIIEPAQSVADRQALCGQLEQAIREAWSLRVPVRWAPPGELPRFELKSRRWVSLD